ncbi:uncharacterized protein [Ptychodera flava]|uniref:uncharacterized protein n=1 Tax=Ptychodera flava TaxID=63121 RepID=UPI00396A18D7
MRAKISTVLCILLIWLTSSINKAFEEEEEEDGEVDCLMEKSDFNRSMATEYRMCLPEDDPFQFNPYTQCPFWMKPGTPISNALQKAPICLPETKELRETVFPFYPKRHPLCLPIHAISLAFKLARYRLGAEANTKLFSIRNGMLKVLDEMWNVDHIMNKETVSVTDAENVNYAHEHIGEI